MKCFDDLWKKNAGLLSLAKCGEKETSLREINLLTLDALGFFSTKTLEAKNNSWWFFLEREGENTCRQWRVPKVLLLSRIKLDAGPVHLQQLLHAKDSSLQKSPNIVQLSISNSRAWVQNQSWFEYASQFRVSVKFRPMARPKCGQISGRKGRKRAGGLACPGSEGRGVGGRAGAGGLREVLQTVGPAPPASKPPLPRQLPTLTAALWQSNLCLRRTCSAHFKLLSPQHSLIFQADCLDIQHGKGKGPHQHCGHRPRGLWWVNVLKSRLYLYPKIHFPQWNKSQKPRSISQASPPPPVTWSTSAVESTRGPLRSSRRRPRSLARYPD